METEITGIWAALVHDTPLWAGIDAPPAARSEILQKFSEGSPAIAIDSLTEKKVRFEAAHQHGAFRCLDINGNIFLAPQKYERMLSFFLNRATGKSAAGNSQEEALQMMHSGHNLLLTGGPGTGKSFILQQFLNEKAAQKTNGRPLRVIIAAPTGKAAARYMRTESGPTALVECSTIHRVLGVGHDRSRPRYDARNPIGCDILIVDEISMVDLGLFAALISALPPQTQVILAGDLNQLPAVDGIPLDATVKFLATEGLLKQTALTQVRRFSAEKAEAFAAIAANGITAITNQTQGIQSIEMAKRELHGFLADYAKTRFCTAEAEALRAELKQKFMAGADAAQTVTRALQYLGRQIVLTERREGPLGSLALNAEVRREVEANLGTKNRTLTPIVATQNNYRLNIFNGDSGLLFGEEDGLFAIFVSAEGEIRRISLSQFTGWEMAYALTIHKSQGSEYDHVFVITNGLAPIGNHRLLYTAVTRSKEMAKVMKII